MAFTLIGRFVAADQEQTVTSKNDASKTFQRRQLYLDCSRYDSITGERMQDNFPLLDFGGKGLEQLNELLKQGLKKGDLVAVDFVVDGRTYKDATGATKNFTGIRPYAIQRYIPKTQQAQAPAPVPQPAQQQAAPAQQVQQSPVQQQAQDPFGAAPKKDDGLPF